jgi:hypothetical protein
MKLENVRRGSPTTSITGKRLRISSHRMLQLQFGQPVAHAPVDAEAERQVLTRTRAVDDELSGRSIASSSRLPDRYHIATLSPLRIGLAAQLGVLHGGAPHVQPAASASG